MLMRAARQRRPLLSLAADSRTVAEIPDPRSPALPPLRTQLAGIQSAVEDTPHVDASSRQRRPLSSLPPILDVVNFRPRIAGAPLGRPL